MSEITTDFQGLSYDFRQEGDDTPEAPMIRYYINSAELRAKKLAEAARQHWFVESVPQAQKSAA